jgi:hypothetical protein
MAFLAAAQPSMLPMGQRGSDVVYTPDRVAADIVDHFRPRGRILDPCSGDGVFLRHLPAGTDWCEIEKGRDFFQWTEPVDWLFGNPPYSVFSDWLRHSFTIAKDIVYLIPVNKVFNSYTMMRDIERWGGVREIYTIAAGGSLRFPVGFAVGAVHLQRGYRGGTVTTFSKVVKP